MCQQFWIDQIAATQAQIIAYNDAILQLTLDPMASYSLDTGQTKQTVTQQNLYSLQLAMTGLLNKLATLEARVYGRSVYVVPAF